MALAYDVQIRQFGTAREVANFLNTWKNVLVSVTDIQYDSGSNNWAVFFTGAQQINAAMSAEVVRPTVTENRS